MLDDYIVNFSIERLVKKFFILLMILVACVGGCNFVNEKLGLSNDNPLEQMTEAIIEESTGLDIDLSY